MSWMDFGDVRKQRGITAKKLAKAGGALVDGNQAANDAARRVRSDKGKRNKAGKVKLPPPPRNMPRDQVRRWEGIARKVEKGKPLSGRDKTFLRANGRTV